MKNISVVFTLLVVTVLLSAITVFSSSGPFGTFGPNDYTDAGKGVDISRNLTVGGSGPYAAFGYMGTEPGVVSKLSATPGGSGPYGAFDIYGMLPSSGSMSVGNRAECFMVAKNCLPDR
ncbi:MAG: hypothetical protein HXX11_18080 [Desulfuromonadales bacterium]|nr:hypothetical protein [Desulfuromonadales bacterium]